MVITFDPSSKEAEAGRSLRALGQPVLHNEFQESQNYTTERPYLKRNTATKKKMVLLWKKRFLQKAAAELRAFWNNDLFSPKQKNG